ncbi:MAG TPA: hypothetical protein VJQ84_01790 [Solirubrobacterales bacterium]|nr:hypothetical protein [Solirubrobacterales bacterium]
MRSIGVADENRAALLVGQPAEVTASLMASQGGLADVPTHLVVGGGDLYLVDTRQGTSVLAHSTRHSSADNAYVTLPPTVASLWIDAMSRSRRWLWPVRSPLDRAPTGPYLFAGSSQDIVARAMCNGPSGSCTLSLGAGSILQESGDIRITAELVLRYAPTFQG